MSTPASNTDTQQEETLTIEQQVNNYVSQMMSDEKFELPEEVQSNELLKLAVTTEKRRRDSQASYTRSQQALKVAEAERAELLAKSKVGLTSGQLTELEELKHSDVDAYYEKRKQFEKANKEEFKANLDTVAQTISAEEEANRRIDLINNFKATHNIDLNDDFVENELPAKLVKKLSDGEYTFEQFLDKVLDFVNKPIKTTQTIKQPDLSKVGGSSTPDNDEKQVKETIGKQWDKIVF